MPLVPDTVRNLAASLAIMAILIAALYLGKDILIPLALSAILAFILAPMVAWLVNHNIPRGAAVGGIVGLTVILFAAAAVGFSAQMLSVTNTLNSNKQNLVTKLRDITGKDATEGVLGRAARSFDALQRAITQEFESDEKKSAEPAVVVRQDNSPSASSSLKDAARAAIGPLATFLVTFLFAAFLLAQNHDLRDRIVRVLGTDNMSGTTAALSQAGDRLGHLFLGQAMLNASFGLFIAVALWVIGVPNPLLWGVTAALLRFVPYIGALLSSLPPLLLAAAVDPGWTKFIATAAVFLISEPLMGHVLDPLILGKRAGLSPFAMVAAASFWTLIWGPVGLLLAAPLTMVLVVIGEKIPQLNFLSILLGDKPALDPNMQFYHRLLSNDPTFALDQLERHIDSSSIKSVSDSVVLPALRLAALDLRNGRIGSDKVEEMQETMQEVIDELPDNANLPANEQDGTSPTIIIPARGAVDMIAASYVAAALNQSGAGPATALKINSGTLALSSLKSEAGGQSPGTIVLSCVGGTDVKHLRHLASRAVKEFPLTKIMVCNWGEKNAPPDGNGTSVSLQGNTTECSSLAELAYLLQLGRQK